MKAATIKKSAVVSISDGAKLGHVDDVLFDLGGLRVAGLNISASGQRATLPFADIHSIGHDAITVPTNEVARWATTNTALAGLPGLDQMGKLKVVNEAGTLLGTVHDVEIDPKSGAITQVQAHKGGVLGVGGTTVTLAAKDIRSIGDEVMVVRYEEPEGKA